VLRVSEAYLVAAHRAAAKLKRLRDERPDPRSDLLEDSHLWRRLLAIAWELDGEQPVGLCANLSCLRCLGATLVSLDGHLRLRATGDYWISESAFQAECRVFLDPYKPALLGMLATLEVEAISR
jgi:hypothetical protein